MGLGVMTALNQATRKLAPHQWYNLHLMHQYTRSDYFGLRPSRSVAGRLVRAILVLPFSDPSQSLLTDRMSTTLKYAHEVEDALRRLSRLGLCPHNDREKNWDAFRAFSFIMTRGTKDSVVLDMGSASYGRILPWLHLYGFRNLHGCDLSFESASRRGSIQYVPGNLEETSYRAAYFDFITCLSVIEHGVDLERYFREASRILRPGGYLLTSTDYWCESIATDGYYDDVYDCPVKVFSAEDVPNILEKAARYGLGPVEEIDCSCGDRLMHWKRLDLRFTFLFFVLQRDV